MDKNLDTPIAEIAPIIGGGIQTASIETASKLEDYVEPPCLEACQQLYDMGIATISSSANRNNIGQVAWIDIDATTLCTVNDDRLRRLARAKPENLVEMSNGHAGHSFQLRVPISDGNITAREIQNQFMILLDDAKLLAQPAYCVAPVKYDKMSKHPTYGEAFSDLVDRGASIDEMQAILWLQYDAETQEFSSMDEKTNEYYAQTCANAAPGTSTRVTGSALRR